MRSATNIWLSIFFIFNISLVIRCDDSDPENSEPDSASQEDLSPSQIPGEKSKILKYHNSFRSQVVPPASNMLKMTWSSIAAQQAQDYADMCVFLTHNPPQDRKVPHLGSCGQNIFVSSAKSKWYDAVKSWYSESKNFTYGEEPNISPAPMTGHYTQLVWATSHEVGCGLSYCTGGPWGHFYSYICNYCPAGNIEGQEQYPYKTGEPCGDCADHCSADSLCTNSCPVINKYSNCDSLIEEDPTYCKHETCKASCRCADKLYKEYPWDTNVSASN